MSTQNVEQLIEKWDTKGFKLNELSDDTLKRNTAILLENEHRYILNEADTLTGDIAQFKKILMPLTRRVFPNLLANEIVGVQPMAGPVSLAYALRFKASGTYAGVAGTEMGYNSMDDTYTSAGTSGYTTYTDGGSGYSGHSGYNSAAVTASGEAWSDTAGYGTTIPEGRTVVDSVTVTAGTRKMKARYSLEAAQDLKNMHGLDIEAELTNMLQYEIGAEIDRELIIRINGLGKIQDNGSTKVLSYTVSGGDTRGEAEKFRTLYTRLVREAAGIAKRTRRGAGNFLIASGNVVTALDSLGTFLMQPLAGANPMDIGPGVAKVGSIENRFQVYRDTFATTDYCTVGFKGQGVQNSGVVYCPYIPLMISKAVEPGNFTPIIGLMTRYGIVDHLMNSADFYTNMTVDFAGMTGFSTVI